MYLVDLSVVRKLLWLACGWWSRVDRRIIFLVFLLSFFAGDAVNLHQSRNRTITFLSSIWSCKSPWSLHGSCQVGKETCTQRHAESVSQTATIQENVFECKLANCAFWSLGGVSSVCDHQKKKMPKVRPSLSKVHFLYSIRIKLAVFLFLTKHLTTFCPIKPCYVKQMKLSSLSMISNFLQKKLAILIFHRSHLLTRLFLGRAWRQGIRKGYFV